jgi:hypothetical protein
MATSTAVASAYWMSLNPDTYAGTQVSFTDRGRVFAGVVKQVEYDNSVDRVAIRFEDGVEVTLLPETDVTVYRMSPVV